MNPEETQSKFRTYTNQHLLHELIVRRTVGEHESDFALRYIKTGPNYYGSERMGQTDVYRVELDSSRSLIRTKKERNESNTKGEYTWGAGGYFPVLIFNDGSRWFATVYRDVHAPTWPNTYATPSGLSHLLVGEIAEGVERTSDREFSEELIFLNKQNLGGIGFENSQGRMFAFLKEQSIPRKIIDDGKTLIQVYMDGQIVDESRPFAIGWGTKQDTVTTVVHACTMYPETVIPDRRNLLILNGEVVPKEDTIDIFSRKVTLFNLDDFYKKNPLVGIVEYKARFDQDRIEVNESEMAYDDIKMLEPLAAAIRKVQAMREQEFYLYFS